jgi:hypothetical protein
MKKIHTLADVAAAFGRDNVVAMQAEVEAIIATPHTAASLFAALKPIFAARVAADRAARASVEVDGALTIAPSGRGRITDAEISGDA